MKITNEQLKQIIREELEAVFQEANPMKKDLTSINRGEGRREPLRNRAVTLALNTFRQADAILQGIRDKGPAAFLGGSLGNIFSKRWAPSKEAQEIKEMFNFAFQKIIKTYGLNFEEAIEIMEATGKEAGLPTEDVIKFLKTQGDSGSTIVIDDPMMQ